MSDLSSFMQLAGVKSRVIRKGEFIGVIIVPNYEISTGKTSIGFYTVADIQVEDLLEGVILGNKLIIMDLSF